MADEKPKPPSGGSKRRRRRSSRNRKQSGPPKNDAANAAANQPGGDGDSSSPSRRRRRRRRSRSKDLQNQQQQQAPVRDMLDAKLPESIFVYTHVLRSSELDTYGFRSDPFLNRSRRLEDFRIDLSALFPEDAEGAGGATERIFDAALHGPINTTLADSVDDDESDHEEVDDEGAPRTHGVDARAASDDDALDEDE